MTFPSGEIDTRLDRAIVIAGYFVFPLAFVPGLLFAAPQDLGCPDCPTNLLLIHRDEDLASVLLALGPVLYGTLFLIVVVRAAQRWREADPFLRLQRTPVYVTALLTFLLVTVARAGAGEAAYWAAFISAWLTPFAFVGGLLRSTISHLVEELRASRARIVEAGDAERRRLERDLHDGAQSRLVALALLLRSARKRADGEVAELLDQAQEELHTSLEELRELARGIHPAVLTDRGLEPALEALTSRAPLPVTLDVESDERLPGTGRERGVLRGLRGADQRRQVRAGDAGHGRRPAPERQRHRRGDRRRRGRRRRGRRVRPARPRRPAGRARRHASARQPGRTRHAAAC